jgi:hypothetical protein
VQDAGWSPSNRIKKNSGLVKLYYELERHILWLKKSFQKNYENHDANLEKQTHCNLLHFKERGTVVL